MSIDEPLTVSGAVSGSFPLDKTGRGNLILTNGANSFNGATVAGGTLTVEAGSSASAGGLGRPSGGTTVDAGATLALEPPPSTGRPPTLGENPNSSFRVGAPPAGIIVVQAGLTLQNGATLDSISGVNAWNGAITLPPSVGFTGRLSPSLLEVDDGRLTVNGIIGGPAGELVKTGPGELHLPDINTFSGGADIQEGTVVAETTGALGAASNTVTVEDGATLGLLARPLLFPLPVSITVAQKLILNGQGVNNEGALFNEAGNNTVSGSVTSSFSFVGVAGGSQLTVNSLLGQGLVEVGGGTLVLPNNDPNYQGPTIVLAGSLVVDAAHALGASGSDTVIMDQFTQMVVGKAETVGAALTLEAGSTLQLASGADWSGPVALDGTVTVSVPSGSATIAGDISGTKGAALEIFGSLTLTGFDTYDGITDVLSGTLTVQSFLGNSDVFVESGATLQGGPQTTLGSLTAEFGSTVIGKGETVDGSVNLASGSTFIAENSSASQPALVVTAGTVTLNGNLAIAFGFSPSKGVPITLIANHTGRAVNGQFAGLPEGGTLKVQVLFFTFTYRITYLGSPSGHDVVLTLTGSTFG